MLRYWAPTFARSRPNEVGQLRHCEYDSEMVDSLAVHQRLCL